MADPICRWRNATPNTVKELVNALPHNIISKADFRAYMYSSWNGDFFHTPYQLACQLGLYYESEDDIYYPRFDHDITEEEAQNYLEYWIQRYYIPNPYTKRGFRNLTEPVFLLQSIVNCVEKNPSIIKINDVALEIFKEETRNKDILINAINSYSKFVDISGDGTITLKAGYKKYMTMFDRDNKKSFFENFNQSKSSKKTIDAIGLKQLFTNYLTQLGLGASTVSGYSSVLMRESYISAIKLLPTQKSIYDLGVDVNVEKLKEFNQYQDVINLNSKDHNLFSSSIEQYIRFLESDIIKEYKRNKTSQIIFYGAPGTGKSHKVKEITEGKSKTVVTFHPDTDYSSFVGAYKPTLHEDGKTITYGFVPQAFAKAYVNAWKDTNKDYYLVIEEINRGNCAQIFGDIFQLLDRNGEGYSDYVIDVDKDFENYLKEELTSIADYPVKIMELAKEADLEGDFSFAKIALPANLHIIATMNTSDQSLFPMDSAFKRRWDWEYRPIDYKKAKEIKIEIDGEQYNWGEFIETVNSKIKEINCSEDKQLGTFFVKAKDGIIPFEQLRSKVMFYLWFEVYKDEAGTADCIFRQTEEDSKGFSFGDLFEPNAKDIIKNFLKFLKVNPTSPVVAASIETSTDTEETE